MTEHFDALIVGSGFGGSVMAYRLADADLTTCLLERGKPFPPNSFPRSPHDFRSNFWDPSQGFYGMFNVWGFRGLNAVVSSGLGGGSLIYANVLLRKDEKWFVKDGFKDGVYEYWPVTRADLDPHYDRVEKIMNAQRYPLDRAPYSATPKTLAMQAAAKQLGLEWMLPNLAFGDGSQSQWVAADERFTPKPRLSFAGSFSSCPGRHSSRYRGRGFSHRHFGTVGRRTLDLFGRFTCAEASHRRMMDLYD